MMSDEPIAKDDIVYADGSSAILGDVTAVDENGITVAWRATTTVEQPEDLVKAPPITSEATLSVAIHVANDEFDPTPVPEDLVVEFHYADKTNIGAYALERGDSLLPAARKIWSQFSPCSESLPTHIIIRPALPTD
jgi:hypothetical protein